MTLPNAGGGDSVPRWRRLPRVEEAPLKSELLLFNPDSSQFYLLNQTMMFVWRNCEGKSPEAMVAEMASAFSGAEEAVVREDVQKALVELESLGLIVLDGAREGA